MGRVLGAWQKSGSQHSLPNPRVWHPGATGPVYRRYVETIKRRMAKAEFLAKQI